MSSSASTWYFVAQGDRMGPHTLNEMRGRLAEGAIAGETLVWTQGMTAWLPAADLPILLEPLEPDEPPPLPALEAEAPAESLPSAAYAWRRWLARSVDLLCFGIVVLVGSGVDPATLQPTEVPPYLQVIAMGLWVPVEALLLAVVGTTPGKALFSIRVATLDGIRPSFATAFSRAARVWVQGTGLGLPLVTLITEAVSYTRLTRTGSTSWDDALALRVEHGRIGPVRGAIMIGLIVLVAASLATVL